MPLYVYYQVAVAQRLDAKVEVDRILAWATQQQVPGRLLRRPEASADGYETWMEVYADAPAHFGALLENFANSTRLSAYAGARRIEMFDTWR